MSSQTILITGATSGIGKDAALFLAGRGHRVIATGRRQAALEQLRKTDPRILTLRLDVTDPQAVTWAARAVDELTDGHGVDILVNNAGFGMMGPVELLSDKDLREQFETNVFGLLAMTRAFVPAMRRRGAGRVINVGSVGGRVTFPFMGAYHASKYAVEALSDTLRYELRGFGIQVSLVEPGLVKSEFIERTAERILPYQQVASAYSDVLDRYQTITDELDKHGADPRVVSRAIARAVESRFPRARYLVTVDAWVQLALYKLVPTRLLDWGIAVLLSAGRRYLPSAPEFTETEEVPLPMGAK